MKEVKYVELPKSTLGYKYQCIEEYTYKSKRYGKCVTVEKGFLSDGATSAPDIDSDCWWVHDVLCDRGTFDDGTPCTNWQASCILYDIMREEGRNYFRANRWRWATFAFGGGIARDNGMFKLKEK
jgi:hypothetical protein